MISAGLLLAFTVLAVLTVRAQDLSSSSARHTLTAAAMLALTLVSAEGLLRLVLPAHGPYDWRRLSVPLAWKQWSVELDGQTIGAPSTLFSLDERTVRRSPTSTRVLFIGDSFTAGKGVRQGESFVQRIAERLEGVEVLNHAIAGLDSDTEAALYLHYSAKWNPDTVIWGFVLNDLQPAPGTSSDCIDPSKSGMFDFIVDRRPQARVPHSIRLFDVIETSWRNRAMTRCMLDSYVQRYDPLINPTGLSSLQQQLTRVATEVKGRGGRFVVVLLPLMHELEAYPFDDAHAVISDIAREAGADVIDVTPTFRGRHAPDLWASVDDHHPNSDAHAMIAQHLSEALDLQRTRTLHTCGEVCLAEEPPSARAWLAAAQAQSEMYEPTQRATKPHRIVAKVMALQSVAMDAAMTEDARRTLHQLSAKDTPRR